MSQMREDGRPAVTVVVVNFNGGHLVLECLAALRKQTFRNFKTVVVDNASTDGSRAAVAAHFPEVQVLAASENLGFAGGVNFALRQAVSSRWLALLNPDARPESSWLEALVTAASVYPQAAAFGSQLLMADDPTCLDGIGDVYHVSGLVWRTGYGRRKKPADDLPREIFSPCAAAALYRTDVVRSLGGMDTKLFCYLDDVDLGFRLRLAGYDCRYVPSAVAFHKGSAISGFHSDFQTYLSHRNIVRVFVKNMPEPLFSLFLPLHLIMNLATLALLALQGRGGAAWRAKRDALLALPMDWRDRSIVQATRRVGLLGLLRFLTWLPLRR